MKEKKIKEFFDKMSVNRNITLESDPILKYEQDMRQRAVIDLLKPKQKDRILDVGCGNARDLITLAKRGMNCTGIDMSEGMINGGKKDIEKKNLKIDLLIGSATELPFDDEIFDKIICSEVIEHTPAYEKTVEEMLRILKKNGRIVITTPNRISLYGVYRKFWDLIFRILKKEGGGHPYDEWKTEKEVIKVLTKYGGKIERKIGICFIPSHYFYI